jgi:predicted metal-dependent hydrolase
MTMFLPIRSWISSKIKAKTERQLTVDGVSIQLVRKAIRSLRLGVYPPDGQVRMSAPYRMSDKAIRQFVISRMAWIKRYRSKFAGRERHLPREYVTGESHFYQGVRYSLNVTYKDAVPNVAITDNASIDMQVRPGSGKKERARVLMAWYRERLKELLPPMVAKWEPVLGVKVNEIGVKRMKTRWGSCNIRAHRVWLNLALAEKSMPCLEYILVHEMVHLLERHHNARFTAYMNKFVPQWKSLKKELHQTSLRA